MVVEKEKCDLYGSREQEKVEYEVIKLPLQDYVSHVRKFVSKSWRNLKAETGKVKDSKEAVSDKVTGAFQSIGIQDSRMVMQAGAITTAAIVGVVLARKRSWFQRVLYPAVGGAGVWAVIYYSHSQNRTNLYSKLKSLQTDYRKANKNK